MIKNFSIGDKVWMTKCMGDIFTTICVSITETKRASNKIYYKITERFPIWHDNKYFFNTKEEADDSTNICNIELQSNIKIQKMISTFWESIPEDKYLDEGIYDVTNIEFFSFNEDEKKIKHEEIQKFILDHPNYMIADAYDIYFTFILAEKPNQIRTSIGSGFNYGSNNIITNCPQSILIIAEND